ncbi:MAG: phage DNA packaging protein J [Planctomycetes bacterium]|nr:phage DNA packaging protein J [Planctomycetota bacterium]
MCSPPQPLLGKEGKRQGQRPWA